MVDATTATPTSTAPPNLRNGTHMLEPTYSGYVSSTQDSLILFEACLQGLLSHVGRRPHDRERSQLVRSGSIFIYEESSSGIKRWTDGVTWSPSRILGNFLVYRELDKPFPPGEKKRAMRKTVRRSSSSAVPGSGAAPATRPGEPYPRPETVSNRSPSYSRPSSAVPAGFADRNPQSEIERALVGSLVDSYGFKEDGLVKKTMSVIVRGVTHHLVSYYSVDDVLSGRLRSPSLDPTLRFIHPREELLKQSFRAPVTDMEASMPAPASAVDTSSLPNSHMMYYQPRPSVVPAPAGYPIPTSQPAPYYHMGYTSNSTPQLSTYPAMAGQPAVTMTPHVQASPSTAPYYATPQPSTVAPQQPQQQQSPSSIPNTQPQPQPPNYAQVNIQPKIEDAHYYPHESA